MGHDNLMIEIGKRIKEARKTTKLSQKELSDLSEMNRNTFARIEKGKSFPSGKLLWVLVEKFGISSDYILTGKAKEASKIKDLFPDIPDSKEFEEFLKSLSDKLLYHSIMSEYYRIKKKTKKNSNDEEKSQIENE